MRKIQQNVVDLDYGQSFSSSSQIKLIILSVTSTAFSVPVRDFFNRADDVGSD